MDWHQQLLELEQRLQSREVRQAPAQLAVLLAEDFLEFGVSGGIWRKAEVLALLPREAFVERKIRDFVVRPLGEHLAQVTYRCRNLSSAHDSLRSSLWRLEQGRWQMLFHQGTACPDQ